MKKRLFRAAMAAVIVGVVIAPALIWSGQKTDTTGRDPVAFKEPPVFTVGPDMTPQALASREREKLLSILEGQAWSKEYEPTIEGLRAIPRGVAPTPVAEYTGLTAAEREKLVKLRSGESQPGEVDAGPKKEQPVLRFEGPPRVPGPEGLTPQERAKLDACRKLESRVGNGEGGRSR